MPSLNINSLFKGKKATTVPVIPVPKNVKQALCIDEAHPNGRFKLEPTEGMCLYDQCYLFEDVNYVNKDENKKTDTLLELMKLYKSMPGQFKFTFANEQRDMTAFMEEIFCPIHGEKFPELKEGIGCWINQKIEEGVRDIKRTLMLTVTCRARSFEEAASYFATLDTTLQNIFASLGSRLYRMSGVERLAVLQRMLRAGGQGIPPERLKQGNDGWKNQILPASMEQHMDYMKLNDQYVSVLFAQDYSQTLREDKVIHGLCELPFPTYITLDMEPVEKRLVREKYLNAHTSNERVIANERSRNNSLGQFGQGVSYQLDKKKTELEETMALIDDNDEEGVFVGLLVYVSAESLEELTQRVDTLKQNAITNNYTLETYNHRQLKALNTVLPIGGRQVNHMRFFLTSSAVALQPFYASDLQDKDGYVYGLNETTKRLLRGNRKKLPSPHGMISGHTGSGKSYCIKTTEIAPTLILTDDDEFVIDPNNEQKDFIGGLHGGQYFDFTPHCQIYLNPFEVPPHIADGRDVDRDVFVAEMKSYADSFCEAVMKNIVVTQVHFMYIGRAVEQMYREYFSQRFQSRKNVPTWTKVRENLIRQMGAMEHQEERKTILEIINSLEEYTEGAYDFFAYPSNQDMHSRLVGFGLKNLPEAAKKPAMITIMECLKMRIRKNDSEHRATHLIVDETQTLCEDESSADFLLYAVETYRKMGAIITLAFQNLTHVLEHPKLRDMLSNCPLKLFFDQGGVDADSLSRIQELSAVEYRALSNSEPGHGVMVWGSQVYLMDGRMDKTNVLYAKFNTDAHEKAEEEKRREQERKEQEEEA